VKASSFEESVRFIVIMIMMTVVDSVHKFPTHAKSVKLQKKGFFICTRVPEWNGREKNIYGTKFISSFVAKPFININ